MEMAELRELLTSGQLVVFAGAGLSLAPPACAPLFRPLRSMLYEELSGSLSGDLPGALLLPPERLFDEAGRLRGGVEPAPEVLFEALDTLTVPVHHLLEDAVGVSQPNLAHHVLAGGSAGRARWSSPPTSTGESRTALRPLGSSPPSPRPAMR